MTIARRLAALALLTSVSAVATAAPVPKEQLAKPPSNAQHFVIVSESNTHGGEWRWTAPDGTVWLRKSQELRGWITETDAAVKLDSLGNPTFVEVRGVSTAGDAAETFKIDGGKASWDSGADKGETAAADAFYLARGGPTALEGLLVERAFRDGDGTVDLLPLGKARLVKADTLTLEGRDGPAKAQLVYLEGLNAEPRPFWVDDKGRHFATVGYFGLMREGYEQHFKHMRTVQDQAMIAATKAIGAKFLTAEARAPTVIDNVKMFDADNGVFRNGMSVLVENGKIAKVASTAAFTAPAGVRRIDGAGKTLIPGLWDSHKHFENAYDLLANLAWGMTSIRSPGNGIDETKREVARRAAGEIAAPEIFAAAIIDQKHPLSAQGATLVSSEKEAVEAVRAIKDAGLWGVKFYTSMNPKWIAPAAAEAHRLGLRTLGHVPAGMRPMEAIEAGYDELTHLNFVVMQAMPKSVVDKANTRARMEGPAQYARTMDLDGPVMKPFIAELARRQIWIDPTIVIFEGMMTKEEPSLGKAYSPFAGTLPAVVERSIQSGGYPLFGDVTRAQMIESYQRMVQLVGALHRAGVPIVAGTDGWGLELYRELEIYREAGLSPAEVLKTATINPARNVGIADRTGSIKVGKEADMVLVEGDVEADLGALRRVRTVISDGYVMDGDALRTAAGFSGMPK